MTKKSEKKSNNFNVNYDLLKKAMPFVLLLFVMWFAFFIRSGPISLNSLDERIESNTYLQIQSMISQQIDVQYPNLNAAYKQEMLEKEYQKILETGTYEFNGETIVIDDIVKQNTEVIKGAFKAENNQTYLNAIDPYHFYRLSNDVLINGHEGDTLKENANGEMQPFDSQKLAPQGAFRAQKPEFHIWLESKLFKLNNIDENSTVGEKTKVIFLIPVIFAMLCAIPTYFIIRKFSNDLFAFFGSLLLVSVGTFVSRTIAGFVDTDAYNVFFPLMVMMLLIYAFVSKNKVLNIVLTLFAGLFMGMFIWAWGSGWFIFVFSSISLLGYAVYILIINFINKEKDYKNSINTFITFVIFAISSYIFTLILKGTNIFTHSYNNLFGSIGGIAAISQTNIWPNVLSSVAELNAASFGQIVSAVGGKIVFIIALLGLLFLSLDFEKKKEDKFSLYNRILSVFAVIWFVSIIVGNSFVSLTANHQLTFIVLLFLPVGVGLVFSLINKNTNPKIFLLMILTVWMAGTIYMTLNGVRFVLLLAPAFATAFGFGLYYISKIVNTFFAEEFEIKSGFGKVVTGFVLTSVLFLVLFVPMYSNAKVISEGTMPNFDDAWYSTMYKIRDNSSENAIITSWWDFGHFFAAISDRGVTFDGGSQTTPQAHWVGKLLLEEDEEVAHDILKMLVCGGNTAFEYILNVTADDTRGVKSNKLIYSTFGKSNEEKIQILKNYKYYTFSDEEIDEVMERLSCENPPENFLITSEDMVGKAGVWTHWGSWDFTKKYVHDNYKIKSAEEIAEEIDESESLVSTYVEELCAIDIKAETENVKRENLINQWFADYPSYLGNGKCLIENSSMLCGMVFSVNSNNMINHFSATDYPSFEGCKQTGTSQVVCGYELDLESMEIKTEDFPIDISYKNVDIISAENNVTSLYDGDGVFDLTLIPLGNGVVNTYFSQSPLGMSLFTKLFYLDGLGTKYFEKFDEVDSVTGVKVKVWKVKWEE